MSASKLGLDGRVCLQVKVRRGNEQTLCPIDVISYNIRQSHGNIGEAEPLSNANKGNSKPQNS